MDKQTLIDMFLANKGECFPAESIAHIRSKLASMDEERVFMMTNIEYKKPLIMLLISIFVGELGIDRRAQAAHLRWLRCVVAGGPLSCQR